MFNSIDMEIENSATNFESLVPRIQEILGSPKPVGKTSSADDYSLTMDHRVDPEDLRLPGILSQEEWSIAEKVTRDTEIEVFGSKLSPLNQALLFRTIYVQLLKMQLKLN